MAVTAHPTVHQVFATAGCALDDSASVRRMQAHHRQDVVRADVEFLQERVRLGTDVALARQRQGQRPSDAAHEVDQAIVRVLAPVAHELGAWRSMREIGEPDEVIAVRAGVAPSLIALALDGIPGRPRELLVQTQLIEAARRWRAGSDEAEVADAFDRSQGWLRRAKRSGRLWLAPDRLRLTDVAECVGVAPALVGLWARRGLLPPPDGREVQGRWWWRTTIDSWAETSLRHRCLHCTARLPSLTGLRVHTTKLHGT